MATPTEWYTSLQQGGAPVSAPAGRRGGGRRGGKFDSFLSKQRSLRHAMAKEELKQMKERSMQSSRWRYPSAQPVRPRPPARGRGPQRPSGATAAKAMLNMSGRMGPMPFQTQDLGTWLDYIGPGRAHEGLMQTGRLLSGGQSLDPGPGEKKSPYSRVIGLPGREKGGTIPKTGPYELHEGEVVVSADQVDRPLMAALKADKLNKMYSGQMDGKGTGPGPPTAKSMVKDEFRGGTLHGYQGGTLEEILAGEQMSAEPSYETGAGVSGWGPLTPKAVRDLRRLFGGGAGEKTEKPMHPDLGEPPPGFSDEEISRRLIAEGAEGAGREKTFDPLEILRRIGADAVEVAGDLSRYTPGGGFGLEPGVEAAELEEEVSVEPDEEPPGVEALLALSPEQEQQERDRLGAIANEATFARAAGGDRGLGEAGPLTIQRGGPTQRTAYEPGDRADPAVREREKREFNATMNQMKADRLHDYLMKAGPDLDPETFKAIQGQAKQLQAINKAEKDRQTVIDENAKDRITEMQKAFTDYQGQLARATATGEASKNVGLRQEKQHLREKMSRYELKFWEEADGGASRDTLEQMAAAMFDIEAALEGIEAGDQGYDEARDAYMNYRMSVLGE